MAGTNKAELVKVSFYGDTLEATKDGDKVWVSLRRCCENLGIDFPTQLVKLRDKAWAVIGLIPTTATDGKDYQTSMISLESLPMWLATLEARRIKADVREKLTKYQIEAAKVLAEHFFGKRQTEQASQPPLPQNPSFRAVYSHLISMNQRVSLLNDAQTLSLGLMCDQQGSIEELQAQVRSLVADREEQKKSELPVAVLPKSELPVPQKTVRVMIRERIERYVEQTKAEFHDCWTTLYTQFRLLRKINLQLRAKHRGGNTGPLDIAEEIGQIEALWAVACSVFKLKGEK